MEKKLIILLFLLTGCLNERTFACSRFLNEDSTTISLDAVNDTILTFRVREAFKLPHTLLYDEAGRSFLDSQLDDTYHYENTYLIREYELFPEKECSLRMTLDDLKNRRYFCE